MTEAELVQRWTAAADDVALAMAHEPDGKVDAKLEEMRLRIVDQFLVLFPGVEPETMGAGVDTIIDTIRNRRREIEAGGISNRGLQ